jgi:hypothetical protein
MFGAWIGFGAEPSKEQKILTLPKTPVQTLDLTNLTFTVSMNTNLTVFITSQTRFFQKGKYAISKDLAVGESVQGTLKRSDDGRHEAVRIYIGDQPKK